IAVPRKLGSLHACPPACNTLPSARMVCPEQKMSRSLPSGLARGTGLNVLVAGSQTVAEGPPMQSCPLHIKIFPVSMSTMLIATRGQLITEDHWPIKAGSLGLVTVTVTVLESAVLPEVSVARAKMVCVPTDTVELSQATLYGAAVSWDPTALLSTKNC